MENLTGLDTPRRNCLLRRRYQGKTGGNPDFDRKRIQLILEADKKYGALKK